MSIMSSRYKLLVKEILNLIREGKIEKDLGVSVIQGLSAGDKSPKDRFPPIAIIGYSGRLPQSSKIMDFWGGLVKGKDFVGTLSPKRKEHILRFFRDAGVKIHERELDDWKGAFLEEVDTFAADYFGISKAEAKLMDPSHRLFLEVSEETFQSAGYSKEKINGQRVGVFSGDSSSNYMDAFNKSSPLAITGNVPSFFPARVSYVYNLHGPAFSVQSTCSSSFLAIHLACRSLQRGECDMALVGGAQVYAFPGNFFLQNSESAGIISPSGICCPFDENADGIGRGEAVIGFLLKPLDAAERDGDPIAAVILGSACNNDGRSAAISAPSPQSQSQVIQEAMKQAQIEPSEISYIEAHGTGTKLGDPIEIRGITDAFEHFDLPRQFCGIGSIKGNMGHALDGAAGLSSLLKVVLSIENELIPPSIHIKRLNPEIDFLRSPLFPLLRPFTWKRGNKRRVAGISCFSFNGTNVHLLVSDPSKPNKTQPVEIPFRRESYWISPETLLHPQARKEAPPENKKDSLEELWESILGNGASLKEKSFFALGGNSLQLMELISMCKKKFNVDIATPVFLTSPKFETLKTLIKEA